MHFTSKSILLNGGHVTKIKLGIPKIFGNYIIPEKTWAVTFMEFNDILNARPSVTENIEGIDIDILQIENGNVLSVAVKKDDIPTLESKKFDITGQIIFANDSWEKVDKIIIKDLVYNDVNGLRKSVLNKT